MFNFRQKILFSYLAVFLIFLSVLFPFASRTVKKIVINAMQDRSRELIAKIQSAPNNDALIRRLKDQKSQIFFRVSVITDEKKLLYDTHTKRLLGPRFSQEYIVEHPEVIQAFETNSGYHEDYSDILSQKFSYLAKAFDFHGKKYVMRTAFPYKYVTDVTRDFEFGFLALATAVLLLFSVMTWVIINHLTRPIQEIITAVRPYQEGQQKHLPEVKISSASPNDEFGRLARTLNLMSTKIQRHIDSLTIERNEKQVVLDSLEEGVIAVSPDMTVTFANGMALKILHMTHEDLLGQNFRVTDQEKCYDLLDQCQRDNEPKIDTLQVQNDKGRFFYDIVAAPKKDKTGAILVVQDKTSHYKMLRMRTDFVANASHELKTPITIIQGFAEALNDNPDLPVETTTDVTGKIVKNCERMTTLIKDLLTLTDVEHIPESRLEECDLFALTNNCAKTVNQMYEDASITVNKPEDEEIFLHLDPNLMEMAITNLIENSAKYSSGPAEIKVNMWRTRKSVKFTVEDKGIGIPKIDQEHIFERFHRANNSLPFSLPFPLWVHADSVVRGSYCGWMLLYNVSLFCALCEIGLHCGGGVFFSSPRSPFPFFRSFFFFVCTRGEMRPWRRCTLPSQSASVSFYLSDSAGIRL